MQLSNPKALDNDEKWRFDIARKSSEIHHNLELHYYDSINQKK